jgi:rod shape determining protein RodA
VATRRELSFWQPALIVPIVLLLVIGGLTIYSATMLSRSGDDALFIRHLVAVFLGALSGLLMAWLPPRILEDLAPVLYLLALVMLGVVLFAGEAHHGARRWLSLGPLRFQPSEPAKVAMILFLGHYLARKRCDLSNFWSLVGALAIIGVPFLLVLREPDLGTSLSFLAVGFGMLLWAGLPWLTLFSLVSPLVMAIISSRVFLWLPFLVAAIALLRKRRVGWLLVGLYGALQIGIALETPRLWRSLEPYQRARLSTFLNPEREPAGAGYQVIQSKIAVGSGCFSGQGYGRGSQKGLAFLPRQHTDFVYSVIGEEGGFVGGALVLLLFGILLLRGLALARRVRSRFGSVVAAGVISLLFYHVAINIAMTLGLAPVTGLPLPFLSFGGSFMVSSIAGAGLLLGVTARRNEY